MKKILLLVLDGVGGLPLAPGGLTELETARTPNMDALLAAGDAGLHVPVGTGVTPGSGPGHLSLFGFDPLEYRVGRGALAALGVEFPLQPGDVAVRGNLCTIDDDGAACTTPDANDRMGHALAAGKGLAAIPQQCYSQGPRGCMLGRCSRACRYWLRN